MWISIEKVWKKRQKEEVPSGWAVLRRRWREVLDQRGCVPPSTWEAWASERSAGLAVTGSNCEAWVGRRQEVVCTVKSVRPSTRMVFSALDRQVSWEKLADPKVLSPQLSCQCAPPRMHSWQGNASPHMHSWPGKHWHYSHQVSSLRWSLACTVAGNQGKEVSPRMHSCRARSNRRWPHAAGPRGFSCGRRHAEL